MSFSKLLVRPQSGTEHTYTIVSFAGHLTWWKTQFIMRDRVVPQTFDDGRGPYSQVSFGK